MLNKNRDKDTKNSNPAQLNRSPPHTVKSDFVVKAYTVIATVITKVARAAWITTPLGKIAQQQATK